MNALHASPQTSSARPEITAALTARTGLDEAVLGDVVRCFYGRVRADPLLGPVFEARITDWEPHFATMVRFWSSVALMTGRYHGAPLPLHLPLPVGGAHFERWLALFRWTARELCSPQGADWLIERAERIAHNMLANIERARARPAPPARPFPTRRPT